MPIGRAFAKGSTGVAGCGRNNGDEAESAAGDGADGAAPQPPAAPAPGLRLAELLAARLCHEMSGPAGTLAGAIDIARSQPDMAAEALEIAADAAAALAARLRLLRAAWAGGAEATDPIGLRALCAGLPRHVRADLDGVSPHAQFAAPCVRVLLNLLLLAAEGLPKGGLVAVSEAAPDAVLVVLRGQDAAWPPGLAAWMADAAPAWRAAESAGPRALQGPLTALLAHAAGLRLSFAFAGETEAAPPVLLRLG